MGRKVRKQVMLTEEQAAALARRAKEPGISEGELIRRGIEYICPLVGQEEERGPRSMDELIPWLRARAEKYPGTNQPRMREDDIEFVRERGQQADTSGEYEEPLPRTIQEYIA